MKELSGQPLSWGKVALAIVPGLWLAFQQRTDTSIDVLALFGTAAITLAIASGWLLLSCRLEHRIALWCMPLFGAFLWKGMEFSDQLYMAGRMDLISPLWHLPVWLLAGLVIVGLSVTLFPYWIFKCFRDPLPRSGWALAGLMVFLAAGIVIGAYNGLPYSMVLPILYFAVAGLFVPIAVGALVARWSRLAAILFVVAFEPLWVDVYLSPRGPILYHLFQATTDPSPDFQALNLANLVVSYLPMLSFLVVIPLGLLRSSTQTARLAWLLLPSLLTLIALVVASAWALSGTASEFSSVQWVYSGLVILLLWLPLVLSAIVADAAHRKNTAAPSDATAQAVAQ